VIDAHRPVLEEPCYADAVEGNQDPDEQLEPEAEDDLPDPDRFREPKAVGDIVATLLRRVNKMEYYVPPPVDHEKEAREELERKIIVLRGRGIPAKAAKIVAAAAMNETDALARVKSFLGGKPGSLVLSGTAGCGKTVAAAWAVSLAPREKYVGSYAAGNNGRWPTPYYPHFLDVADLARIQRYGKDGAEAMDPLRHCWLLAIDDVGSEPGDQKAIVGDLLEFLVVRRNDDDLRTILATNLPLDDFSKRFTARLKERINAGGDFFVISSSSLR